MANMNSFASCPRSILLGANNKPLFLLQILQAIWNMGGKAIAASQITKLSMNSLFPSNENETLKALI